MRDVETNCPPRLRATVAEAATEVPSEESLPGSIQKRCRSKGYVGNGMRLTVSPECSANQSID